MTSPNSVPHPSPRRRVPVENPLSFLEDLIREQGDVARYENPYGQVCLFNHPHHVQTVLHSHTFLRTSLLEMTLGKGLLSSEGDAWRTRRRLMQPFFQEHRLPRFGEVTVDRTLAMLDRWTADAGRAEPIDVTAELRRLTLDVALKALLSVDLDREPEAWDEAFTVVIDDLGAISLTQFNVPLRITPDRNARFQQASRALDQNIYRVITDRRALDRKPDDLLSWLVTAGDSDTALSDRDIRDEVITMLIAGHETTAIAIAWLFSLLERHPDVETRLVEEVDRELGGRLPSTADLPRLAFTRMVFEEAMRLYPPVCFLTRQAVEDGEVAGHAVPAKTTVLLSPWTTHRHKDFWDEPERFNPDRFAPRETPRHRYSYFPFGGARHQCIGQSFGMIEGPLVIALILQRCRVRIVPGQTVEPRPMITLRLKHPLLATVTPVGRT